MADIIQLLPDHVANQIAAGEVVQRPASVVKELLENAIDADATTIKLIIKDAGKTLIQVIDNGKGMSATDARLSFERHATSKIRTAEDLFNLHTKGFRGEALASIAAIAHVELKTKPEHDELGTQITIEGSDVTSQEVVVTPKGTSISVKHLFFNIPARRNFLKSNAVETRHIIDEFHRVALTHPTIAFSMYHNGSEVFHLPESKTRQRIVNIFGGKTNEKLVPVEETTEVLKISGFVGKPEFSKKSKSEQFFFVNNRFIKSAYLNHAINAAYEGLLRDGNQPAYFLNLTVDPKSIDINIHPTKTEIKFDDEHTLYAILRSSVKHSLGQFNIAPVLDFEYDTNLDTPYDYKDKNASNPTVEVDRNFNPFIEQRSSGKQVTAFKRQTPNNWDSLYVGLESKGTRSKHDFSQVEYESEEQTVSIFKNDTSIDEVQKTYQLHNKYIISTVKSGMLLIDQNRAHQRILYEGLLRSMTVKEAVSQQLLFPLQLHFSSNEMTILQQLKEDLEATGFVFSKFGKEHIDVIGVPVNVPDSEVSIILEQLISDVEHEVPDSHFSATDLLAKSMAKSLAIKAGQTLSNMEQEHLVNSLFACKEPSVSPANRATFITLNVDELDKKSTMRGITDTVKHLIIINVLMFIGTIFIGNGVFYEWFALYFPKNDLFKPWQFITHMFMHGGASMEHFSIFHIGFNMFALWMFGTPVEQVFGAKKFIIFYLFSGLGAALIMIGFYYFKYLPSEGALLQSGMSLSEIHQILSTNQVGQSVTAAQRVELQNMFNIFNSSMVGASGAIMGVLVAFGMLFPESKLMLIFLPIPIKAKYFIPGIIALDLFSALTGQSIFSPSNTAFAAHVGGALTGFIMMWLWKKNEFDKHRWN